MRKVNKERPGRVALMNALSLSLSLRQQMTRCLDVSVFLRRYQATTNTVDQERLRHFPPHVSKFGKAGATSCFTQQRLFCHYEEVRLAIFTPFP